MNKDTDVVVGPGMVEIDASLIAEIIVTVCRTSRGDADKAANAIIDYLITAVKGRRVY